jgi:hypothetical protein
MPSVRAPKRGTPRWRCGRHSRTPPPRSRSPPRACVLSEQRPRARARPPPRGASASRTLMARYGGLPMRAAPTRARRRGFPFCLLPCRSHRPRGLKEMMGSSRCLVRSSRCISLALRDAGCGRRGRRRNLLIEGLAHQRADTTSGFAGSAFQHAALERFVEDSSTADRLLSPRARGAPRRTPAPEGAAVSAGWLLNPEGDEATLMTSRSSGQDAGPAPGATDQVHQLAQEERIARGALVELCDQIVARPRANCAEAPDSVAPDPRARARRTLPGRASRDTCQSMAPAALVAMS